jgi:hypothetical protein
MRKEGVSSELRSPPTMALNSNQNRKVGVLLFFLLAPRGLSVAHNA